MDNKQQQSGFFIIFLILLFSLAGCTEKPADLEKIPLKLAMAIQPSSSLAMIADDLGFFTANGLAMEIIAYPSGKRALHDSFFQGKSEIALTADVPVALAALAGKEFKILTSTFTANNVNRIIARSDAGIVSPKDLKDKKIATQKGSAVHFFMHLFLTEHGLTPEDYQAVFFKAEELPDQLAAGTIDAFSMREPYISQAQAKLPNNHVVFHSPGLYRQLDLAVTNKQTVEKKPQALKRFLQSLIQAEQYINEHPQQAIGIIAERLGVQTNKIESAWPEISFQVSLDQSLLLMLEDIARWAIRADLTETQTIPNFLDRIHDESLRQVSAGSISIIK